MNWTSSQINLEDSGTKNDVTNPFEEMKKVIAILTNCNSNVSIVKLELYLD